MRATSSIRSASRCTSSCAEVGHLDLEVAVAPLDAEAEPLEDRGRLARARSARPSSPSTPRRCAARSARRRRHRRRDVDRAGHHPRAAQLDHQPRREALRREGELGVQLLLEARARLGAQRRASSRSGGCSGRSRSRPPSRPAWSRRRPRCAAPPMIPPMPVGPSASQTSTASASNTRSSPSSVTSRSPSRARRTCSAGPGDPVEVVGVHRLAEQQHHVVGDVDDVADRALADRRSGAPSATAATARPARR